MSTLGGNVVIRNGNELDFCWRECIKSLLAVCDEVVVCDGQSTDGTQEEIRDWIKREHRLKLCVYPWPNPKADIEWFVKWINYAREHVRCDWELQLDADEVLHERSHQEIRSFIRNGFKAATCHRYNFWGDARHLIPPGYCCGHLVVRLAPQSIWIPSDGTTPESARLGHTCAVISQPSAIEIFHYGFIRKRDPFYKKERLIQNAFFGSYDPRLEKCEREGTDFVKEIPFGHPLVPFNKPHPAVALPWLRERGYLS